MWKQAVLLLGVWNKFARRRVFVACIAGFHQLCWHYSRIGLWVPIVLLSYLFYWTQIAVNELVKSWYDYFPILILSFFLTWQNLHCLYINIYYITIDNTRMALMKIAISNNSFHYIFLLLFLLLDYFFGLMRECKVWNHSVLCLLCLL